MEWVYVLADQMLTIILLVAVFELVLYVVLLYDFPKQVHIQLPLGMFFEEGDHLLKFVSIVFYTSFILKIGWVSAEHWNVAPLFVCLDYLVHD